MNLFYESNFWKFCCISCLTEQLPKYVEELVHGSKAFISLNTSHLKDFKYNYHKYEFHVY